MDTGFGKAEATSPNNGQPSIDTVPKLWTIDFLRNPEPWTFQLQMDILRKPQTVDSAGFLQNPIVRTFQRRYVSGIIVLGTVKAERKSTMAKKPLDAEEIAELRSNPYVASIISGRISFTPEFKRVAYEQLMNGKSMRTILEEHGIDTDVLGESRIYSIAHKLRRNADREEGFADLRTQNSRKPAKGTKEQTLANRVEQLEHELAYTRQEVEFLKKIHTADLEARKLWESKQRRK